MHICMRSHGSNLPSNFIRGKPGCFCPVANSGRSECAQRRIVLDAIGKVDQRLWRGTPPHEEPLKGRPGS